HDGAHSGMDSDAIPRLSNAESINLSRTQRVDQNRWWYHDQPHLPIGIDSGGRQPVSQLVVVAGEGIDHREGERLAPGFFAAGNYPFQRRGMNARGASFGSSLPCHLFPE